MVKTDNIIKIESIICLNLSIFIFITCCACSAKPLDRAKIAEYHENELLLYDSFYALDNIYCDLDDDFDLAFHYFIAVYDPEKNIVGFNIGVSMYPKYEKTIKDYGMFIMVDENLRELIKTSFIVPTFTDAVIEFDDKYLYLTYEPYVTPAGMNTGSIFYSIPLDGLTEEYIIQKIKEGLYFRVFKNKKLGPLKKIIYSNEITFYEETLDPDGSQEPLFKASRDLFPFGGLLKTDNP